jgi:hypothetical protein
MEIIASMSLFGVIALIALPNLKGYDDPLKNGTAQTVAYLKQIRSLAVSTTSAYTVSGYSSTELRTSTSSRCSEAGTEVTNMRLSLPRQTTLVSPGWSVCFNSRGLADLDPEIQIQDQLGTLRRVKVYIGGGVRTL